MSLLERDAFQEKLLGWLRQAASGEGRLVLLAGEAGVGKTVFVRDFCKIIESKAKVLVGACDPLSTPRPLEPLMDIAAVLGGELEHLLQEVDGRTQAFRSFLSTLQQTAKPMVVVFEDVHWADEATLDLLRFLGRRIGNTRTLLIATYRDDEVGPKHPLRTVIGDLATSVAVCKLVLSPLSENAVRILTEGTTTDPVALYRQTGGNPFFVTEVLATNTPGIPATVRDAILARIARLSPESRATLEAAAVIGVRVEPWLLNLIIGSEADTLEECISLGPLNSHGNMLNFRHELVREAVLDALSPQRSIILHRQVLEALYATGSGDSVRLSHHAEAAGDTQAVLKYAPAAARRAAQLKAHHEAAALYARALRFADSLAPADQALLLEAYAEECALTDQLPETIRAEQHAAEIWRREGNRLKEGEVLSNLSSSLMAAGRNVEAAQMDQAALEVLEALPPSPELASAYAGRATLRLLNGDSDEVITWGDKAVTLAEQFQDKPTLIVAYSRVGTAMLQRGDTLGHAYLEQSLDIALEVKSDSCTSMGYLNLAAAACEDYQFTNADRYLELGINYCIERDIDTIRLYMMAWKALSLMYQGRWSEAAEVALSVMNRRRSGVTPFSYIVALVVLGRIRARRGDPEATVILNEALELASQTGTLQRLGPVRAARAEAAWLAGDEDGVRKETCAVLELALKQEHGWHLGELSYWQWKAGALDASTPLLAKPFVLQIAGCSAEAAAEWQELRCPYETARALAESDDEVALKQAFKIFEDLGARPAATATAKRLRELGVKGVPRGPRPTTSVNFANLTRRELEVLELLAEGRSNAAISTKLVRSPKTVGHHVSAVLAKLGVQNRTEAVRKAMALGILTPK